MQIRAETAADRDAIAAVLRAAFEDEYEVGLVDRLRADGDVLAALVAAIDGAVVGHILFSPLPIATADGVLPAAALAPLAVHPDRQRQGIGGALVRHGLAACRAQEIAMVVVVGDPAYYPRFGFSAKLAAGLASPFSGRHCMALALDPACAAGVAGSVRYARAFGLANGG